MQQQHNKLLVGANYPALVVLETYKGMVASKLYKNETPSHANLRLQNITIFVYRVAILPIIIDQTPPDVGFDSRTSVVTSSITRFPYEI